MKNLFKIFYITLILSTDTSAFSQSICFSEIMYNSDSTLQSKNWVELHNYGASSVNIGNWTFRDETAINSYVIPGGTVIEAGGFLVLAQRVDTFHMIHPEVDNVVGPFIFGLDNTSGSVRLYDLSNTLIKSVNYVDSMPWPKAADGLGSSLEILNYTGDSNDPANWIAGCPGGSPGVAYSACDYDVLISEVNYHCADDFNTKNWVELWNHSGASVDISNWIFRDNNINHHFDIPAGTVLAADARLVICDSLDAMHTLWPYVTNVIGEFDFGLGNGGDGVRLYDASGKLRYVLRYDDASPWPADADGLGYTLELDDENGNPNDPATWIAGCPHGSPGTALILPCGSAVEDTEIPAMITSAPSPFHESVYFTLKPGFIHELTQIFITNMLGEKIIELPVVNTIFWDGMQNGTPVPNGIYFLHVADSNGKLQTLQFIKQ